jgi:hypothetical protein
LALPSLFPTCSTSCEIKLHSGYPICHNQGDG